MSKFGELLQTDNWKNEKHVPVIECSDEVNADEVFQVKVSLGKEIAHPNTTEHHIRWIQLYFKPDDGKFAYQIGNFEFSAHGEAAKGANEGPVYTNHSIIAEMKTKASGTLYATALCNIHGLWESTKEIMVK